MSRRPVLDALVRDSAILLASDTVGRAASVLLDAALPALPVVGDDARLAGIFGEQEFLGAVSSAASTTSWRSSRPPARNPCAHT